MAEAKTLKVTLVKSPIGRSADQHKTLRALGLGKVNSSHVLPDNDATRGMIFKVKHLVTVEEL
ncbi:50S ribosomal protein L30 [Phoenicibacter congonensis]|uniref:50S ribosomal protein L30 n=1 Tax=Phoenicibacter congonensis TaxID=1944646 RepID=UPI0009A8CC4C|nr:50S ribosomal protein L30 [Phoenicibacter congonensis]